MQITKELMMLGVAGLALCACAGAVGKSTPKGFTDDFDAALKASAQGNRPVVAVFSGSDWCGWCVKLEKEVFADAAFLKAATNRYVLLFVDSPNDKSVLSAQAAKRNPELTKKYEIQGFPTVLVLDAKGTVLGKTGYQRGGGAAYLKHLEKLVANGPLVAKHLKPYRDEFNKLLVAFRGDAEKLFKDVKRDDKAAIEAAMGKMKALAPGYRTKAKDIRKRFRAAAIPEELSEEKEALLGEMKRFIGFLRQIIEGPKKAGGKED